jgi:peptidoglycan/LPS O-acetylase OafA/YrhL
MSAMEWTHNSSVPVVNQFPRLVRGRIPSLDGLRALAILLVLASHVAGKPFYLPMLGLRQHLPIPPIPGELGVRVFFVISGFLITTLLLQERQKRGRISLKKFYMRRALRILPACYVFLFLLIVATKVQKVAIPADSLITSFLYLRNYDWHWDHPGYWYTAHLWSLSIEEQFYLMWPVALKLMGTRRAVVVAFCTIPFANLMRLFVPGASAGFGKNMDAIACGCILACLWGHLGQNQRWQSFLSSWVFWVAPVTILASSKFTMTEGASSAIATGVSNVLIAIVIERVVRYNEGTFAKLLNIRVLVWIGTLSYSLYLWQQPWLTGGQTRWKSFPLNVAAACICAVLSYSLIERPFLRLKDRWRSVPKVERSLQAK